MTKLKVIYLLEINLAESFLADMGGHTNIFDYIMTGPVGKKGDN